MAGVDIDECSSDPPSEDETDFDTKVGDIFAALPHALADMAYGGGQNMHEALIKKGSLPVMVLLLGEPHALETRLAAARFMAKVTYFGANYDAVMQAGGIQPSLRKKLK